MNLKSPGEQREGAMTYHYWYHLGEIQAIRQVLGQKDLPEHVGDIETEAPHRPE